MNLAFFKNMLWMSSLNEECKHDHYGELFIFFIIWPYRVFVIASLLCWLAFGIHCAYALFLVWILTALASFYNYIYAKYPRLQTYVEEEIRKDIARAEAKRKAEYQKLVELHKDDPPKPVTKMF